MIQLGRAPTAFPEDVISAPSFHVRRLTSTCITPVLGEVIQHLLPRQALTLTCTNLHTDTHIYTIKNKQTKPEPRHEIWKEKAVERESNVGRTVKQGPQGKDLDRITDPIPSLWDYAGMQLIDRRATRDL